MSWRKIADYLKGRKYIREILANPVDLTEFKERPSPRLITGLILMGFSYVIGWPAVAFLTFLAVRLNEPLIAVIGCPTTYGLSYLVFIIGAWLSRAPHYMGTLARYAIQSFVKKIII